MDHCPDDCHCISILANIIASFIINEIAFFFSGLMDLDG
jgi:hypothetical protein